MNTLSRRAALVVLSAALLAALQGPSRAAIRVAAASLPAGSVPSTINYQGRLIDDGFPVTGIRVISFRLYDDLAAGTLLQTVPSQQVNVSQGLFNTTIALSTTALAGPLQKYLEVQVGSQVLSPREPLQSVPYALVAKSLEENLEISTVSVGTQLISSGTLAVASIQALTGSPYFSVLSPVHMSSVTLTLDGNAATSLTTTGMVGVGTNAPVYGLTINGGAGNGTMVLQNNGSGTTTGDGFQLSLSPAGTVDLNNKETGAMTFDTGGAEAARIDSSGQFGIGTAPGAKLDVNGTARFGNTGTQSAFSTAGSLTLAPNATLNLSGTTGSVVTQASVTAGAFIGDGSGVTKVTAIAVPASGVTGGTFQNSAYTFQNVVNFAGTGIWNASGSLGAGTAAPATKLDVNGNAQFGSGATKSTFTTTGALQLATVLTPLYGGSGANLSGASLGQIPYFAAGGVVNALAAGSAGQVLTSNGTAAPGWAATSGLTAGTATNLAGGSAGVVPYQSGTGSTAFTAVGTSGDLLTSAGTGTPTWTTATSANTASAVVQRNASGNFSAGTITAALSGNATTATALAANGGNCAANSFPLGVDASGAVESCSTSISGNAATATALAANGGNCAAGSFPLGVDASGAAESCSGSISGNAATATTAVGFVSKTSAQIGALTPTAVGQAYYCSDCTVSAVCVSTGTTLASFSDVGARVNPCK